MQFPVLVETPSELDGAYLVTPQLEVGHQGEAVEGSWHGGDGPAACVTARRGVTAAYHSDTAGPPGAGPPAGAYNQGLSQMRPHPTGTDRRR
jgi:hypothetical protein